MRQVGRTTRMLEAAIAAAKTGDYVFVICASTLHARSLRESCRRMCDGTIAGTKVYPPESNGISFESGESVHVDFDNMRVLGAHPSCVVLVDHFAIEQRYGKILEMLHRFDPKPVEVTR